MDSVGIYQKINSISAPEYNYIVFAVDDSSFFGKDHEDNIVFMMQSQSKNIMPIHQETKSLRFIFNKKCTFMQEDIETTKRMHLFVCKEKDEDKIHAFIRLTHAFSLNEFMGDQYYLAKLFASISALFDKKRTIVETELQGLFAELYTILYMHSIGCDIAKSWQSHKRMKFDFSINAIKRLEVKSTLRPARIHHFKHDQLLSELYDIRIVSIMLQKNDQGISLGELVEEIRDLYSDNYALVMHIESIVGNIEKDDLYKVKYDRQYLSEHIKFYNAKVVPHFNEKTPEGIFNAEYDCELDNVQYESEADIKAWIEE